jgi:hypothetical protein
MGKRKYRHLSSKDVAEKSWSALTSEDNIRKMKDNYTKKMDELPNNKDAETRYKDGVSKWVDSVRTPEVRDAIRKAVGKAVSIYLRERFKITTTPTA